MTTAAVERKSRIKGFVAQGEPILQLDIVASSMDIDLAEIEQTDSDVLRAIRTQIGKHSQTQRRKALRALVLTAPSLTAMKALHDLSIIYLHKRQYRRLAWCQAMSQLLEQEYEGNDSELVRHRQIRSSITLYAELYRNAGPSVPLLTLFEGHVKTLQNQNKHPEAFDLLYQMVQNSRIFLAERHRLNLLRLSAKSLSQMLQDGPSVYPQLCPEATYPAFANKAYKLLSRLFTVVGLSPEATNPFAQLFEATRLCEWFPADPVAFKHVHRISFFMLSCALHSLNDQDRCEAILNNYTKYCQDVLCQMGLRSEAKRHYKDFEQVLAIPEPYFAHRPIQSKAALTLSSALHDAIADHGELEIPRIKALCERNMLWNLNQYQIDSDLKQELLISARETIATCEKRSLFKSDDLAQAHMALGSFYAAQNSRQAACYHFNSAWQSTDTHTQNHSLIMLAVALRIEDWSLSQLIIAELQRKPDVSEMNTPARLVAALFMVYANNNQPIKALEVLRRFKSRIALMHELSFAKTIEILRQWSCGQNPMYSKMIEEFAERLSQTKPVNNATKPGESLESLHQELLAIAREGNRPPASRIREASREFDGFLSLNPKTGVFLVNRAMDLIAQAPEDCRLTLKLSYFRIFSATSIRRHHFYLLKKLRPGTASQPVGE